MPYYIHLYTYIENVARINYLLNENIKQKLINTC